MAENTYIPPFSEWHYYHLNDYYFPRFAVNLILITAGALRKIM